MPFTPPNNSTPDTLDDPSNTVSELATGSQSTRGQAHVRTKDGERDGAQDQATAERQEFRQQLLIRLKYGEAELEFDMAAKLRIIYQVQRDDRDRVMAMVNSDQLQTWIATTKSSALFINTEYDGPSMLQPTSFICAKLVESIASLPGHEEPESPTSFPLAFFCGDHLRERDPYSGPRGMMRNLLTQLLLAYRDFDLREIQQVQNLNYDDVQDLCHVFDLLITQLPHHIMVYCVVDAVSYYEENTAMCEEAFKMVLNLAIIAERTKKGGCGFKLLLMSHWNSHVLHKAMLDEEGDVAWMPARVPRQDDFNETMWSYLVDSKLGCAGS